MLRARLTSSHFVGRAGELAELELALRDSALGRPALVLLGGDSGVGKTRLVSEFERICRDHGPTPEREAPFVLRGEAVEQGEGELPYGPLLSALRPLARERHPALQALSRRARSQLAALLPGLDEELELAAERHDPSAQLRLFDALLELVELLSEKQPVVLVLEDMHWADRSTLAFAQFLARSLRRERVMLLMTYRTDELHRRHALRPLLAELERLERAHRIQLAPFDRDELVAALRDILGDAPSESLVDRLLARTEGNPLYLEELLAAGLDGRGATPQSLRDAFMLRIERLPVDAQRAARVIAVGRALDEATIAEVSGIETEALHTALREAVAEHVLVADEAGRLAFRHALLREAIYDDLLPGERGELHLALARAYEQREDYDVEWAATIASHYAAAGEQPAALRATIRAALAARDAHAYGDAAELAERALELWPRVGGASDGVPLDQLELLELAASAHGVAGDWQRAEMLHRRALEALEPDSDQRRYAVVLGRLARSQWALNRGLEGVETAQRALAMLPAGDASRERASLLAWLARTRFLRGRFRDAVTDAQNALEAAVQAEDTHTQGEVLNTLGMAEMALGRVEAGVTRLHQARELAQANDDIEGAAYAYSNLADMLNIAGRTRDALETANQGLAATPQRLTRSHDWMMLTVSELAFELGDWETARASLGAPASQQVGVLLIFRLIRDADLALGAGQDEVAGRCLSELEPLVARSSEAQWIGALGALLAELRRRRHDLPGAREAVAAALDRLELCTDDVSRIARVTAAGLRVEADVAQRARDLRERRQERDAIARARIHMDRLKAAAQEGGPVERAWRAVGLAELARARGRSDSKLWRRAAEEWDGIERPFQAAIARWRAAEGDVEAGERAAAAAVAATALRAARALGSSWLVAELETLADRARLDLEHASAPPRPVEADGEAEDPFGLTRRERQVLALIAEGATNRQIGAALFMAEKTASVHVSRILAKLGVKSRTQAAAMAHRLRLGA